MVNERTAHKRIADDKEVFELQIRACDLFPQKMMIHLRGKRKSKLVSIISCVMK